MSLGAKILSIINSNPRMKYNARSIDQVLQGKYDYVVDQKRIDRITTTLLRMADRGKIRRIRRGFYQAKASLETLSIIETPETLLHGIKIEIKEILGISSDSNILADWCKGHRFREVKNKAGTSMRRWCKAVLWRDRWMTVTVHEKGLVEIFMKAGDNPLSFPLFVAWCDWLDGFFQPLMYQRENAFVVQVGIGKDFEEVHLDGLTCIRLHKFRNDWASIYEREDGRVRFEHHLKLDIRLDEAINMLDIITTPVPRKEVVVDVVSKDEYRDVA